MLITFISYLDSCKNIDKTYNDLLNQYKGLKYWYILHDKDIDNNGELKKPHYHNVIDIQFHDVNHSGIEKKHIAEMFGLTGNQITKDVKNEVGIFRYLTHLDDNDKARYTIEDIISNDIDRVKSAMDVVPSKKKDANEELRDFIEWIDKQGLLTERDLYMYQIKNNLAFKFAPISKMINYFFNEHNNKIVGFFKEEEVVYENKAYKI